MKKVVHLIKKILFNLFFLYTFNIMIGPANIIIPINIITILLMTVFGVPSLFSLIIIKILSF